MTAGGTGLVLPITCGRDGHEHLVADEAIDTGHAGHYVTLCGHDLLAVALAYPPGPRCWHCIAMREDRTTQRPPRWSRRTPARNVGQAGRATTRPGPDHGGARARPS
ncbi:MAG: hypothetical protein ACRDT0_23035 [Pseudonocardiaceae bacterium]